MRSSFGEIEDFFQTRCTSDGCTFGAFRLSVFVSPLNMIDQTLSNIFLLIYGMNVAHGSELNYFCRREFVFEMDFCSLAQPKKKKKDETNSQSR